MFLFGIMLILFYGIYMDDTPAWMECTSILNKIKAELMTEAMEELDSQVKRRNIDVKGSLITLPDRPEDTEMKMFVIRRLVSEADRIREMYGRDAASDPGSSAEVERRERARIFLLGVEKIVMLVRYESMIDPWSYEVGKMADMSDPADIFRRTATGTDRMELIEFVLGSKVMERESVLTADEHGILVRAAVPGS